MSGAYYNEIDLYAAQWLRNLIAAGHIAAGDVDERSIADVDPVDLLGYDQCHFFAGIGVWSHSLRLAGWADDEHVWTGSCPCQPFSAAGKGEGTDDARHLWPEWFRLIREHRPVRVFGEQVAAAIRHDWLDLVSADLEGLDYAVGAAVLGAHSVGAPHIRQRLYFVADAVGERIRDCGPGSNDGEARGAEAARAQRERVRTHFGNDGDLATDLLADAGGARYARPGLETVHGGRADQGSLSGAAGRGEPSGRPGERLGDAAGGGRRERGDEALAGSGGHAHGAEQPGSVGDAQRQGPQGHAGDERDGNQPRRLGEDEAGPVAETGAAHSVADAELHDGRADEPERRQEGRAADRGPGPTNGFWRDAVWIVCRDGKARPVEPGTFPLAHGVAGRLGRLRAYGNAINAQAAAAFIRAYMEVRP